MRGIVSRANAHPGSSPGSGTKVFSRLERGRVYGRWMSSFFIRARNVPSLRPRRSAAFPRPLTFQSQDSSTARMCTRSTSSSVPGAS